MKQTILWIIKLALLSLAVEGQTEKRFGCDPDDLSVYYIGNKIPLSCNKGKLCNYASTELSKICAPNYEVCWFRCKNSNVFTLDEDLEFPCPTGTKCNEKMEKTCAPCILKVCDDEPKWTCSDKTTFIMGDVVGRCYDGHVCKTENIPPCNNPCTLDDSMPPSPTTLPTTTPSKSSTTESKPTQPNNSSSTVPRTTSEITITDKLGTAMKKPEITTKGPETSTIEPGTITKEPETTTIKPITTSKKPLEPNTSDATKVTTQSSRLNQSTLSTPLSTGGGKTTISLTIARTSIKPETTTSSKTSPTIPNSSMTTTSALTVPPFKIPNCNDGLGAIYPCREGPSPNIYYYKCKYYSPVWFDYDVKLCKNIKSDPFCTGKVKCN